MMRPQMLPVMSVMVAKASETSVMLAAAASSRRSLLDQIPDAAEHRDKKARERSDGRGHVEIDDAEDRSLVQLVGNLEEDGVQIPGENQTGKHGQSHDDF